MSKFEVGDVVYAGRYGYVKAKVTRVITETVTQDYGISTKEEETVRYNLSDGGNYESDKVFGSLDELFEDVKGRIRDHTQNFPERENAPRGSD